MSIVLDGLTLPDELIWTDKYEWTGVVSNSQYTLGGKNIIQQSKIEQNAGRVITLGTDDEGAWITKTNLDNLFLKAQILDYTMILVLHDLTQYSVQFRHTDPPVIEAIPINAGRNPGSGAFYDLILRLVIL